NGGPFAGTVGIDVTGFSTALDQTTLSSTNASNKIVYLGSTQGGTYTATTLGVGANNTYYLGTGGSSLSINSQVLGSTNNVQFGALSNTLNGTSVNLTNSGGTVILNTPQAYSGNSMFNGGQSVQVA